MDTRALALISLTGLAAPLLAQDVPPTKTQPPSIDKLVEQLGDREFQTRRAAEEALRARGSDALDQLRRAAQEASDPEVQWRLNRVIRRIESGDRRAPRGLRPTPLQPQVDVFPPPTGGVHDLEDAFDRMFERMEKQWGLSIPRSQFFGDSFFRDLRDQMREAQRGMAMGLPGTGQSLQMQISPDGVKIEIAEKGEDGKTETKTYEAPDVETFRARYPEIARRYLRGTEAPHGAWGFHFAPMQPLQPRVHTWPGFDVTPLIETEVEAAAADQGDRLGVYIEDVPPPVREFLRLPDGVGLRVTSVIEGSLAQTLGLAEGDILLQVAGEDIGEPTDVRHALSSVEAGAEVEVKVNRRGSEQMLKASKPQPPADGDTDQGGDEQGKKLRKRTVR